MQTSQRTIFDLGDKVIISPAVWPGKELNVQPGDLSKFAPCGTGTYGYQSHLLSNPFTDAPHQEAVGGVVYFDNDISTDDFKVLMHILNVQPKYSKKSLDYAVFVKESSNPGKDGYLTQMRVISKSGLKNMFGAIDEAGFKIFPGQQQGIVETLMMFIDHECERWGTSFTQDDEKGLCGLFGGDGCWMREQLSFGFMVENDYYSIYRIWSRAWLVTK